MDPFSHELLRAVSSQLCRAVGFGGLHSSCADILSDVLEKYLFELGHTSQRYATLAGRSESTFYDVEQAIFDLGQSTTDVCNSARAMDDIALEKAFPEFPILKSRKVEHESDRTNELPKHIPRHLPSFPETYTYKETAVFEERVTDPGLIRKMKNKQRRQVEVSLTKLHSAQHDTTDQQNDGSKDGQKSQQQNTLGGVTDSQLGLNPFLVPPKQANKTNKGDGSMHNEDDPWSENFVLDKKRKLYDAKDPVPVSSLFPSSRFSGAVQVTAAASFTAHEVESERERKKKRAEWVLNQVHTGDGANAEEGDET